MKPLKIGITGGIGSGKSIVCRILKIMGYPVFDADSAARNLYKENHIRQSVIRLLGEMAYLPNGELNKEFIRGKIFSNQDLLQSLNNILHPEVDLKFRNWISTCTGNEIVFKEAAIMFESGSNKNLDIVVGVVADESTRTKRVMKRDGKSESEIREIMLRQMNQKVMASMCDYTIINDDSLPLIPQILNVLMSVKSKIH